MSKYHFLLIHLRGTTLFRQSIVNTSMNTVTGTGQGLALVAQKHVAVGQVPRDEVLIIFYVHAAVVSEVCAHCTRTLPEISRWCISLDAVSMLVGMCRAIDRRYRRLLVIALSELRALLNVT